MVNLKYLNDGELNQNLQIRFPAVGCIGLHWWAVVGCGGLHWAVVGCSGLHWAVRWLGCIACQMLMPRVWAQLLMAGVSTPLHCS